MNIRKMKVFFRIFQLQPIKILIETLTKRLILQKVNSSIVLLNEQFLAKWWPLDTVKYDGYFDASAMVLQVVRRTSVNRFCY